MHGTLSKNNIDVISCPKCKTKKRRTNEEWIKEAKKVHGDKYDYSKTNFIDTRHTVTITCKKHGDFEQNPTKHLRGGGCPSCAKPIDTKEFIKRAKEVHRR